MSDEPSPQSRKILKSITAALMGAGLELLSGLIFTGAVILLVVSTPLLVIFSPVVVPASIVVLLIMSGFVFSGGCGVAAVTVLTWTYKYVSEKQAPGAEKMDSAMEKTSNKASQTKKVSGAYGEYILIS